MPGIPRLMYMSYPFQIFQTAKYIVVVSEYSHTYRIIYMDGSPHIDYLPFWLGDSRGHWEGDTLVVDALSFNDETWLDKAGNFHSDQLHVVERYTRTGPDTLSVRSNHLGSQDVQQGVEDQRAHDVGTRNPTPG